MFASEMRIDRETNSISPFQNMAIKCILTTRVNCNKAFIFDIVAKHDKTHQ
jgi:hypothetical protein